MRTELSRTFDDVIQEAYDIAKKDPMARVPELNSLQDVYMTRQRLIRACSGGFMTQDSIVRCVSTEPPNPEKFIKILLGGDKKIKPPNTFPKASGFLFDYYNDLLYIWEEKPVVEWASNEENIKWLFALAEKLRIEDLQKREAKLDLKIARREARAAARKEKRSGEER